MCLWAGRGARESEHGTAYSTIYRYTLTHARVLPKTHTEAQSQTSKRKRARIAARAGPSKNIIELHIKREAECAVGGILD